MEGAPSAAQDRRGRVITIGVIAAVAVALLAAAPITLAQAPRAAGSLDRIRDTGRIALGYRADTRPFAYKNESGQAAGYSVSLCQKVADSVKSQLKLNALAVNWVAVTSDERFQALQDGRIDLLCGADTETLARRADVAFSLPIFPGGIGALVRSDAPARLKEVLAGHGQTYRPTWRASASQVLQARAFSAVAGTTGETWLRERIDELQIVAGRSSVSSYDAGIQALLDRKSDVLFGERAILMDAARRHPSARDLMMIDRLFTYEPLALAMARGDEDFRLAVDRALSQLYRSGAIGGLYTSSFGEPDENALTFFRWNALPE